MIRQMRRSRSRTPPPPFFDKAQRRGGAGANLGAARGCLRRWLLQRLALMLVGVLLLCGVAAGIAFLLQLRLEPRAGAGGATRSSDGGGGVFQYQVVALGPADGAGGEGRQGSGGGQRQASSAASAGGSREYLASNLSVLLTGGWPSGVRFYPASFLSETDVLNRTVHCDRPTDGDTTLVYSEPTWLCKNIRVVDQNKSDEEGTQRLPFSDTTSRTLEEMMLTRQKELQGTSWSSSSDACGHLPERRDNVLLLCEMLLAGMRRGLPARGGDEGRGHRRLRWHGAGGPPPQASSVHIPYGNCSLPDQRRVLLVGMATGDAVWFTEKNWKPGFVTDLFCSF